MVRNKTLIAVIGGSHPSKKEAAFAEEVGKELALHGAVLVCGGLGGVMEAACRGAKQEGGLTIGILPGESRDAANAFRATVLRGASWETALADLQAKTVRQSPVVRSVSRQFLSRSMLYPEELWKLARALAREELSFALRTDEGYVVLRTHQNFRQGELPPLEYARAEVRERLLMDLRRSRYEEFLGSVRKRYAIDIRESHAGPDSSATKE